MPTTRDNNKRIAKNTVFLYFRMFFIMAVSLFTSRVVLRTLGVSDFGIYNVVGGVVSMMGVLNSAMSVSTTRYLTFGLGKGDMEKLRDTFNMCLEIYVLIAAIVVVVAETIGLWFVNTQLVIPPDRMVAANWVYQFSIVSMVGSLLLNPYNACIIAHEKMDIYAYISIFEVCAKLAIVYAITIVPIDRLATYGFLYMIANWCTTGFYIFYATKHYPESHLRIYKDAKLFKELLSYSGWNLFGSLSGICKGQGLNILLNIFFNPSVNAARAIAYQVNNAVSQFFTNFYVAVRPQITKYYAQGDRENMFKLVFRSSKMNFYLILLLSLPIEIETPYIIDLWLGQTPEYVIPFIRIIMIITAVDALATPLMTSAHATGHIALYQFTVGMMNIMILPFSYVALKFGTSPVTVFYISLTMCVISLFMRLWIVKRLLDFPVFRYIKEIFFQVILISIGSAIVPGLVYRLLPVNFGTFIIVCLLCVVSVIAFITTIGLTHSERDVIFSAIKNKLHR